MDLTVNPNNVVEMANIITQMRLLIRDVLIPRITNLECDLRDLRKITWPVCQSLKENSQLTDIDSKRLFLECLDDQEVKDLLKEKAEFSHKGEVKMSTHQFLNEEYNELIKVMDS